MYPKKITVDIGKIFWYFATKLLLTIHFFVPMLNFWFSRYDIHDYWMDFSLQRIFHSISICHNWQIFMHWRCSWRYCSCHWHITSCIDSWSCWLLFGLSRGLSKIQLWQNCWLYQFQSLDIFGSCRYLCYLYVYVRSLNSQDKLFFNNIALLRVCR